MIGLIVYIAIGLIAVSVLGILAIVIYYKSVKNKYKKNKNLYEKDAIVVKNKKQNKDMFDRLYQVIYLTYTKMPIIKYYTKKTRLKMEMANDYTE